MRKFLFLISLDFYDVIHGDFLKPKRHWRLLAEITEIQKSLQITLMIRDKAGVQLPMFVSVDARPGDIWTRPDRVGHRVAMLYPHQQDFPGGVVGIRHEVESWVKVSTEKITGKKEHADITGDSVPDGGLPCSQ